MPLAASEDSMWVVSAVGSIPWQGGERFSDHAVSWDGCVSVDDWLKTQPVDTWKAFFNENGYLVVESLLLAEEITRYKDVYDKLLSGEINASNHRHDLGNHVKRKTEMENVCQIMWPQLYVRGLKQGPLHERSQAVSKVILGDDMTFDFDMLIYKAPHTDTETPWHQDESYWPDLSDKRAVSCWVALDDVTIDNGCMWFVPGSFKIDVRKHRPVAEGVHILMTDDVSDSEGKPVPLKAGSCTFHHGRTLHHTKGNTTATHRRAYITNYRPRDMVEQERNLGFDHGKEGLAGILAEAPAAQSRLRDEDNIDQS